MKIILILVMGLLLQNCSGNNNKVMSPQELLKQLGGRIVSCKDVTFKILGLSLATFNTIISLIISAIMFRIGINYDKN